MSMTILGLTLLGCSSPQPSVKLGAIGGGVTGVLLGGLLGAAASQGHTGNGEPTKNALIGAAIVGSLGALLGGGTGYLVDSVTQNDAQTKEMIHSQNIEGIHR